MFRRSDVRPAGPESGVAWPGFCNVSFMIYRPRDRQHDASIPYGANGRLYDAAIGRTDYTQRVACWHVYGRFRRSAQSTIC
jgi:hypothetical protein